jgi:ADP-ribose pyrophosphatase YjhB (NUDIX family)
LPGGRVEPGEPLVDAVTREVLEETGLAVNVGRLIEIVAIEDYVILDYACERRGGELQAGDDAADVALVAPAQLADHALTPAVLRVIAAALALSRLG